MTIDIVKEKLNEHIGENIVITCNMGRNKIEEYNVVLKELYDNVFLVEFNNNDNLEIKSFSYSDVITKNVKIEY